MSSTPGRASDATRRSWGARRPAAWRYLRVEARRLHMSVCAASSVSLRQTGGWRLRFARRVLVECSGSITSFEGDGAK
jgi:hypothetical protein